MLKTFIIIILLVGVTSIALRAAEPDSIAVKEMIAKARTFYFNNPDSCLFYAQKALAISKEIGFIRGETESLTISGEAYRFNGNYPRSLEMQFEALSLCRKTKNKIGEMNALTFIGFTYIELKEAQLGLTYLLEGKVIMDKNYVPGLGNFLLSNIGHAYEKLSRLDSALHYHQLAYHSPGIKSVAPLKALILGRLGTVHTRLKNYDTALYYYHQSFQHSAGIDASAGLPNVQNNIAALYYTLNKRDSAFYYAKKAFETENTFLQKSAVLEASQMLSKLYREKGLSDSALFYSDLGSRMRDSLYGPDKFKQIQLLVLKQQQEQQKIIQNELVYKSRIRIIALVLSLGIFIIIVLLLIRNNRQKQKAKVRIEKAYEELKAAQQQLIQSEKMASLGELTAGIAHEIQNPLNFVNNFSEVNAELIQELQVEAGKGNLEDVKGIAKEIGFNSEKINHHGKRADAIVKGMLQHSRNSSGQKEPTDINALADEYLRLSYHGLRAKDKTFNATMKTDFDKHIGSISIVLQEIGRVILNLINNAFYAVTEKKKAHQPPPPSGEVAFEPTVTVITKKIGDKVLISVADNGSGIPQKALDKIFQPFFTTKSAGEGTGLGLSLSYDIVKAHGGEIRVETKENEGSAFTIKLPVI